MSLPTSIAPSPFQRRIPIGAESHPEGGVHFRVWAPNSASVKVLVGENEDMSGADAHDLASEPGGYHSGVVTTAHAGCFYRFLLENGSFPDPASRYQPGGPHGASQVVDAAAFAWSDQAWPGVPREGQIIYEMHIGTFTSEGTWAAATARLPHLVELGVTLLEVMPISEFPGRYGWGYDGVNLYAPTRIYGPPDEVRRFVDRAHALGLGVILDVVYNHLGPDGNYVKEFAPHYFSERYKNEWGEALNFDDEFSAPVRELFIANSGYWIDEFHFDGLRLDATQQIYDSSPQHLLSDIAACVRAAARGRQTYLVAENEEQEAWLVRAPGTGGYGLDAMWNDDFHHSAVVAMTGRKEAYYSDYHGTPQEFISSAKWGFLFQGQRCKWQKRQRGTASLDLDPSNFVNYLQNHDQVANSLWGRRIHTLTSPARLRALTALLLLGPNTPMLFQGQEFAASSPFLYFADHNPELAQAVASGRAKFLKQFPSIASGEAAARLTNPEDEDTYLRCKLNFAECESHAEIWHLHQDLIRLRRDDPLLGKTARGHFDGAVLSSAAFVLRFLGRAQDDRMLVVNLGSHLHLDPAPEPLLAPPLGCVWEIAWSSEAPRYGGGGTPPLDSEENWHVPAEAAVLLTPRPQ